MENDLRTWKSVKNDDLALKTTILTSKQRFSRSNDALYVKNGDFDV